MSHVSSRRRPVRGKTQFRKLVLMLILSVSTGCHSFVERDGQPASLSRPTSSQPENVTTPRWRRWPEDSEGTSPPVRRSGPEDNPIDSPNEKPTDVARSGPSNDAAYDGPVTFSSDSNSSSHDGSTEVAPGRVDESLPQSATEDGWYLLWQVGDGPEDTNRFRWQNEWLDAMPTDLAVTLERLRQASGGDNEVAAGTAVMGLVRMGEKGLDDRLVQIVHDRKLSLRMRQAAVETLAKSQSEMSRRHLEALLEHYGRDDTDDETGEERTTQTMGQTTPYVPAIHAALLRGLAEHTSPADSRHFRDALASRSADVQVAALEIWAKSAKGPLPDEAVALVEDQRAKVRIAALRAIGNCRHAAAMPHVIAASKNVDLNVRGEAIRTLGKLGGDQAKAALVEMLKDHGEVVRAAAVEALADAGDMTTVVAAAKDESWRVRRAVAAVLARRSGEHNRDVACSLLDDTSTQVGLRMVLSMAQWPLDRAVPLLLDECESRTERIRQAAAEQLTQRWPPAQILLQPMTFAERRAEVVKLRKQWAEESGEAAPESRPSEAPTDSSQRTIVTAAPTITEQHLAQTDTLMQRYLAAETEQEQSEPRSALLQNGPALLAACDRHVFTDHHALDDRVYRELLFAVDPCYAAIEGLGAEDVQQRRQSAQELARLSSQAPLERLALDRVARVAVAEQDPDVWRDLLAVIASDDTEPARRLAYTATSHPSPDVRRRACEYLEDHGSPRNAEMLIARLEDTDISVVRAAVRALGECGSLSDLTPLKRLLTSTDLSLRVETAVALARLGSASGAAAIDRLSYHRDESVRQRIATVAGELADPTYMPILIRLLDDGPGVRRAALDALPKIVDPPFSVGADPSDRTREVTAQLWRDWYAQQNSTVWTR